MSMLCLCPNQCIQTTENDVDLHASAYLEVLSMQWQGREDIVWCTYGVKAQ